MQEDGLFTLGTAFIFAFLFNGDTSFSGSVKYLQIYAGPELEQLSSLIRAKQGVNFVGSWALVAEWRDIPVDRFTPGIVSAKCMISYIQCLGLSCLWQHNMGYPMCH